ncbi:hypothetical protein LEP1GSC039_3167 [Leptospira santarosai str. 2000027870]|uniref:four-helix bundle copper-binding protein n=1 Tax=Leptospira santarosai TaxID=28183 RepID=UPI0002BFBBB8|nr:four-helix bundle copper-binding protein [Leptospira santarosai]EMM88490.1 hypothetical protein LEP1GSC039_3167 [Leptospira santarosai str. 2000027870]
MLTRKELITQSAALLAFASAGSLLAKESDQNHSKSKKSERYLEDREILELASKCILNSEICLAHCDESLSSGDTMLANCLKTVKDTLVLCKAFVSLESSHSPFAQKIAVTCIEACQICEKECRTHESHDRICKNCADSCREFIVELRKKRG